MSSDSMETEVIPEEQPKWLSKVSESISSIHKKLDGFISDLTEAKKLSELAISKAGEASEKTVQTEKQLCKIQLEHEKLQQENKVLKQRLLQIEGQSRRSNLLFDGIAEIQDETWEKTEEILKTFLKNKLDIQENIDFERVHRLGTVENTADNTNNDESKKPRTIIARFSWFKQRDLVWKARTKLNKSNVWITEDFPPEIKRERQILFPIYRSAYNTPGVNTCSLKVNKLFINNKKYTVDNLNELPNALKPENMCTKTDTNKKVTVFFRKESMLSNFNTSAPIIMKGKSYNCVEQFYQSEKAIFFGDEQRAARIMKAVDPRIQKQLGEQIRCSAAENTRWLDQAKKVMADAVFNKMQQNPLACRTLLNTGENQIGEASRDLIWGTGVPLHYKNATNTNTWKGQNLLGSIMCQVRSQLKDSNSSWC